MGNEKVKASLRAVVLATVGLGAVAAPAQAARDRGPGAPGSGVVPLQAVQSTSGGAAPAAGIESFEVTPQDIVTVRTSLGMITRIALPEEPKEAMCGDLYDSGTNTGTFVITKSGNDVYVKPMNAKGQTNLFVETTSNVYNFDLTIVPPKDAHRVVSVNVPNYESKLDAMREKAREEIAAERAQMESEVNKKLEDRRRELEQQNEKALAEEQKKLRATADRRANDFAARRFADGIMQGFEAVALREKRGDLTGLEVVLDDSAYIFEGKLYVRYRLSNKTGEEVTYTEPRIILRGGEKDRAVTASIMTSRGDFVVPAGESAYGVAVFERPTLEKGERL
jgi:hypothetical protein